MFKPIIWDIPAQYESNNAINECIINIPNSYIDQYMTEFEDSAKRLDKFYSEATFNNGRATVQPIIDAVAKLRDELLNKIKVNGSGFDPRAFWRSSEIKAVEDSIQKVFGIRTVEIHPYIEKYNSRQDKFESRIMNAWVYPDKRYQIDGLITEKGFYDKTHSLKMHMVITLEVIRSLEPEEIVAILLHEMGHDIDPALVDIKYTGTKVLVDYITKRKKNADPVCQAFINKIINKFMNKDDKPKSFIDQGTIFIIIIFLCYIFPIFWQLAKLLEPLFATKRGNDKKMKQILDKIKKEKEFNRETYSEAFADNFSRMYGMGAFLMTGLKKLSDAGFEDINRRYKREQSRQRVILSYTLFAINDVHKTDLHRLNNLITEYQRDLADPNIPDKVKKQYQEDLNDLLAVQKKYETEYEDMHNTLNKEIIKVLSDKSEKEMKKEQEEANKKANNDAAKEVHESVEFAESKKAYDKLMKAKESVTSKERNEFYDLFGKSNECSLGKDKDGYYVFTHRARSDSYKEIKDIPKQKVEFVRSTS